MQSGGGFYFFLVFCKSLIKHEFFPIFWEAPNMLEIIYGNYELKEKSQKNFGERVV
jgi:hypothetical protein